MDAIDNETTTTDTEEKPKSTDGRDLTQETEITNVTKNEIGKLVETDSEGTVNDSTSENSIDHPEDT